MSADATNLRAAATDPARQSAEKIAAANGGRLAPTREEAAAILKARGIEPSSTGSPLPAAKAPSYTAADYAGLHVLNTPLPEGADPAAIVDGGRVLAESLQLHPTLAGAVVREIAGAGDVDADAVRTLVEKAGHSYDELLKLAGEAIDRAGLRLGKSLDIKPAELPPHSLVQIALARRVQARHEGAKR